MALREFFSFITSSPSAIPDASNAVNPDASRMLANHRAEKAVKTVIGRRNMSDRRVS